MSFIRKHFGPLFLLALGIALIYSNSLNASFQFDDLQLKDRPNLRITHLSFQTLKGTFFWSPNQKRIYRPIPCLTLGLNFYFGRDNPFGYHIINITIHFLCAIAVYLLFRTVGVHSLDRLDPHQSKRLPVPIFSTIFLSPFVLEDYDLTVFAVPLNPSNHTGILKERLTHRDLLAV